MARTGLSPIKSSRLFSALIFGEWRSVVHEARPDVASVNVHPMLVVTDGGERLAEACRSRLQALGEPA
jgi:hypothetical protein